MLCSSVRRQKILHSISLPSDAIKEQCDINQYSLGLQIILFLYNLFVDETNSNNFLSNHCMLVLLTKCTHIPLNRSGAVSGILYRDGII